MEIDNVSLTATAVTSPAPAPTQPPVPTISPHPTSPRTNLALGRPCTQSSTYAGGIASRAVDGNTDGNYASGSVTQTDINNNYWQVDLQAIAAIHTITLYNRADCCAERLNGATVHVLDHAGRVVESRTLTEESPSVVDFAFAGAEGTYVRVTNIFPNQLSLAEVEVYGVVAGREPTYGPTAAPTAAPTLSPVDLSESIRYTYTYSNGAPEGCCGGFYDDPFLDILNDRGPVPVWVGMSNCISFAGNEDDSLPLLDLGRPHDVTEIVLSYHVKNCGSKYAPKSLLFRGSLTKEEDWAFEARRSEGFPYPNGAYSVRVPTSDWGSVQYIELSEVVPSKSQSVVSRINVFVSMEPTISTPTQLPSTDLTVHIPYEYFYSNGSPEGCCGGYYDDPCLDILNAGGTPNGISKENSISFAGTDSDSMPVLDLGSPHYITEVIVRHINAYAYSKYAPQSMLIKGSLTREDDWTTWTFEENMTGGFRTPNGGHSASLMTSDWGKVQYIQLSEVIPSQSHSLVTRIDVFGYQNVSPVPTAAPATCTGDELIVNLTIDEYPGETKWMVTNKATGNVVMSNPALCIYETFQTTHCLSENCYIFEITDKFADGICCDSGSGSFSVILDGIEILSGSDFGSSASVDFCVEGPTLAPTTTTSATPTSGPAAGQTESPTALPSTSPTTKVPTSLSPTDSPSKVPTSLIPTDSPTKAPNSLPPTNSPTKATTSFSPTDSPTKTPTSLSPTDSPMKVPTSLSPTDSPVKVPTPTPVKSPTKAPTSLFPTNSPMKAPTSLSPTDSPVKIPTLTPVKSPTKAPTSTSACSKHAKKKKCRRDKGNRCAWKKNQDPSCIQQRCSAMKTRGSCRKGGCKWRKNKQKCISD